MFEFPADLSAYQLQEAAAGFSGLIQQLFRVLVCGKRRRNGKDGRNDRHTEY
jgi:hypothetical protein